MTYHMHIYLDLLISVVLMVTAQTNTGIINLSFVKNLEVALFFDKDFLWILTHALMMLKTLNYDLQDKNDFELTTLPALVPVLSTATGDTLLLLIKRAELIINKVTL